MSYIPRVLRISRFCLVALYPIPDPLINVLTVYCFSKLIAEKIRIVHKIIIFYILPKIAQFLTRLLQKVGHKFVWILESGSFWFLVQTRCSFKDYRNLIRKIQLTCRLSEKDLKKIIYIVLICEQIKGIGLEVLFCRFYYFVPNAMAILVPVEI